MNADQKEQSLDDYLLTDAKSEQEILSWARGTSMRVNIARFDEVAGLERFQIGGKKFLVLLASRSLGGTRMEIFVYVPGIHEGWSLLLHRQTGTSAVKVEADQSAKRLLFRSKAGKLLLILPIENVDVAPGPEEM